MKKRGEKLARHRDQACDYWRDLVPNRPRYVLLCNFDEVWIYDFDIQVDEPVDRVLIADLPRRYTALGFLFPDAVKPLFGNDRTAVTNEAAGRIGDVFRALVKRGENRERAQRFTLQYVVALFAEDIGLLPRALFTSIVADCRAGTASSYDLFGSLFRQMNSREAARGGRFRGVDYFNGGLFAQVEPVELTREDLERALRSVSGIENWNGQRRAEPRLRLDT